MHKNTGQHDSSRPPSRSRPVNGFRACWSRLWKRRTHESPPDTGAAAAVRPATAGGTALWCMRTTVPEEPGRLAALCTALAARNIDILSLQTHPLGVQDTGEEHTLDEFLLRAPARLEAEDLHSLADGAGGSDTWAERADAHDLVDVPARVLELAGLTVLDSFGLPLALRRLLGRCTVHSVPAGAPPGGAGAVPAEGVLEETVLRLPDPAGGVLVVERPHLPFTPAEFARARALVELNTRLEQASTHGRASRRQDAPALLAGQGITIRRAGPEDLEAARAMQRRCSRETLSKRYHGLVDGADRLLEHLLSPRFGRTLAAETASGHLVALGHLLWDGDETEAALLVEDAWQHRGIGRALLEQLAALAAEDGAEHMYTITQASDTAVVAAMRGLGLPLDHQVDAGTLVVTAQVSAYDGGEACGAAEDTGKNGRAAGPGGPDGDASHRGA